MIRQYGSLQPIPGASFRLPADLDYKALFDCRRAAEQDGGVLPALNRLARFVNLLESVGIPSGRAKLAAIIHRDATSGALSPEAYRDRFGRDNPNGELVQELRRHGAELIICGQSLLEYGFEPSELDPRVSLAVSSLGVLVSYQLAGFALVTD
jgi:hypothetical protein